MRAPATVSMSANACDMASMRANVAGYCGRDQPDMKRDAPGGGFGFTITYATWKRLHAFTASFGITYGESTSRTARSLSTANGSRGVACCPSTATKRAEV